MRITIFDGAEAAGAMDGWVEEVERGLATRGHAVRRLRLRERTLSQCKGCFGCWIKTPGRCDIRDGSEELLRALLASDLLILTSPTSMGMTSALSRRAIERMLPILHPYFEVVGGEVHHRGRYARYPRMALLYGAEGCDPEDEELLVLLHRKLAIDFKTTLTFAASTARSPEEVSDALARA